ncbi:MAG: ABC transporter ATP-binding protein [Candidatus Muiribacteriota bacterium]
MCFNDYKKKNILLHVKKLKKFFPVYHGLFFKKTSEIKAVDNISFSLRKGETFAIVGESGCGKSTTGRTLINLLKPTSGTINFIDYDNEKVIDISANTSQTKKFIRKKAQMIFQDPYASLNPKMKIGKIVEEPLSINNIGKNKIVRSNLVQELLEKVGLERSAVDRYPHEFSGGQRQRIGIARALALKPSIIIADEPVSALDVSVQAQVLNLLRDLQNEYKLTYLFIAHDLSVVKHISDRVAVMYLGCIVESAKTEELFANPLHPYTKALLSAVLNSNPRKEKKKIIKLKGDVPSPLKKPPGCPFNTRCPYKQEICLKKMPEVLEYKDNHFVACHVVASSGSSTKDKLETGQKFSFL